MKKNIIFIGILLTLTFLNSCNTNDLKNEDAEINITKLDNTQDKVLKETFGKALAKGLAENQELRTFIKLEALKQITKDYDVVYQVVKNKDISGNQRRGTNVLTFRDILLPFFQNEAELIQIENALPLLTIFIPDLGDGSFSAENWNTYSQIPLVGIKANDSDDVKIIRWC